MLGQNFRCGFYEIPADERLKQIKNAGFDAVMFWWGEEFEATDGNRYDLIRYALSLGLTVNTLHYPSTFADYLWRPQLSERYVDGIVAALYDCKDFGVENLVLHTTRELITPPFNESGITAFQKAVLAAEKVGVNIALENTRFPDYNRYMYDRLPSERLTLCYDCGHEHCYTPQHDILAMFGDRVTTTHIHDNNGKRDEHHLIGEGNIDFRKVAANLAGRHVCYNLESYCNETSRYYGKLSLYEFLKLSHDTFFATLPSCIA